jgi:hypothetical protein
MAGPGDDADIVSVCIQLCPSILVGAFSPQIAHVLNTPIVFMTGTGEAPPLLPSVAVFST